MYIYFINILVLIFFHYFFYKNKNPNLELYCWIFSIFFLSIFIGLRFEIGGDWVHYNRFYYYFIQEFDYSSFLNLIDYGLVYVLINKIAFYSGASFIGVNFICALIFMASMATFLNNSRNRWLALAISFPIIIIVLGMGYSRQGLAFSFSLFLIKALENRKLLVAFIYLFLAILSHKTALFLSVFFIIYFWYYKNVINILGLLLIPIIFVIIFYDNFNHLFYFYVGPGQHMNAAGSLPRSFIILLVAALFIFFKKKHIYLNDYQIFVYSCISYMIILIFPFSLITTVAADRLLLYLYSLKVAFVSHANLEDKKINLIIFFIVSMYFLYMVIWIFFGSNSTSWVPYKFLGIN